LPAEFTIASWLFLDQGVLGSQAAREVVRMIMVIRIALDLFAAQILAASHLFCRLLPAGVIRKLALI
jgi:hypothetical protein